MNTLEELQGQLDQLQQEALELKIKLDENFRLAKKMLQLTMNLGMKMLGCHASLSIHNFRKNIAN